MEFETPYWKSKITKYSINRIQGMNMTQAALNAGYSPSMANIAGAHIEPKAELRIKDALSAVGATNDVLAGVILAGLTAEDPAGNINYRERREYTKLALEAKGELKTGNTVAVQINFPAGLAEMLAADAAEYEPEK